jgi:hypothetical protein
MKRDLLEQLIVIRLYKTFPAHMEHDDSSQRPLLDTALNYFNLVHLFVEDMFNAIQPTTLRAPKWNFPVKVPNQYISPISCVNRAKFILLDLIIVSILNEE